MGMSSKGVRTIKRVIPVLILLAGLPARASSDSHVWADYANVKYQFQTCYPSDLLKAQGESPASDGQSFTADGVELTASGIYDVDSETVAQLADEAGKRLAGASGSVTYRRVLPGSFTLSGQSGNDIFYTKAFVSHGTLKHFELTYPKSQAGLYNPVAARLQQCFRDLEK